jgi:hypothetical protein
MRDNRVSLSSMMSEVLTHLPVVDVDYVFAEKSIVDLAKRWIEKHRTEIIKSTKEE